MPKTAKKPSAAIRFQTSVRGPMGTEIRRLAEKEGRSESEMVATLLEEAVRDRAGRGLAEHV